MIKFDGEPTPNDLLSGRVDRIQGEWYWTEWHVGYAQRPCDHSDNFVTKDQADAKFASLLVSVREGFGHKGGKWTETNEGTEEAPRIRFRSLLKSGKPGRITGILYMDRIKRT